MPLPPVPALAPDASTGRIPATLTTALRRTATGLGRRLARGDRATATPTPTPREAPAWRLWADLARGYLSLALTLVPRPRPARTLTVFVAADTVSGPPGGPAPHRPGRRERGPDAAS
ncbi:MULTISPECIES: hypothetical protein [Streptomyces]|uniref:hypothetical protein n=1 Tax=Streptomyces TaxID=1883 RepID=UPI001CFBEECC|nr:hypothetical protein [Streptomyces parvulus]